MIDVDELAREISRRLVDTDGCFEIEMFGDEDDGEANVTDLTRRGEDLIATLIKGAIDKDADLRKRLDELDPHDCPFCGSDT